MSSVTSFLRNLGVEPASPSRQRPPTRGSVIREKIMESSGSLTLTAAEVGSLRDLLESPSPFVAGEINLDELEAVGLEPNMTRRSVNPKRVYGDDNDGDDPGQVDKKLYGTFEALVAPNCTPDPSAPIPYEAIPDSVRDFEADRPQQPRQQVQPQQPRHQVQQNPVAESVVAVIKKTRAVKASQSNSARRQLSESDSRLNDRVAANLSALGGSDDAGYDPLIEAAMANVTA